MLRRRLGRSPVGLPARAADRIRSSCRGARGLLRAPPLAGWEASRQPTPVSQSDACRLSVVEGDAAGPGASGRRRRASSSIPAGGRIGRSGRRAKPAQRCRNNQRRCEQNQKEQQPNRVLREDVRPSRVLHFHEAFQDAREVVAAVKHPQSHRASVAGRPKPLDADDVTAHESVETPRRVLNLRLAPSFQASGGSAYCRFA